MKILDLDMDYFMEYVAYHVSDNETERLSEEGYGDSVWTEYKVRSFLENNLGLSKHNKIRGRIVSGHNKALLYWKELIATKKLVAPFEVIHVDSHADLGLGFLSHQYILNALLGFSVEKRPLHNQYINSSGDFCEESIGDYLLFAIAYRWISRLTYCANPKGDKNDYLWCTLKNFEETDVDESPTSKTIQLLYNPNMDLPKRNDTMATKNDYLRKSIKEPEVPFLIIPTIDDVKFGGDFDFAVMAQSPNYTPASADFIMDVFREYIIEE